MDAPALTARLGPERWYRVLQTVVGLVQEVLHRYAGTRTIATSEGFTAVFGMPMAQEDHARRAVVAALELRQRLHAAPALCTLRVGADLALGMGLHSGLVVVGGLGQARSGGWGRPPRFAVLAPSPGARDKGYEAHPVLQTPAQGTAPIGLPSRDHPPYPFQAQCQTRRDRERGATRSLRLPARTPRRRGLPPSLLPPRLRRPGLRAARPSWLGPSGGRGASGVFGASS